MDMQTFSSSATKPKASALQRCRTKELHSPNVHRKKRVEAPADFVEEQKAYFAAVAAASELEEESCPKTDKWVNGLQLQDDDTSQVSAYNIGLEAVQEDYYEGKLHQETLQGVVISGKLGSEIPLESAGRRSTKPSTRKKLSTNMVLSEIETADMRRRSMIQKKCKKLLILDSSDEENALRYNVGSVENSECKSNCSVAQAEVNDGSYKEQREKLNADLSKLSIQEKASISPQNFKQSLRKPEECEKKSKNQRKVSPQVNDKGELKAIMRECGQSEPISLHAAISEFCNLQHIVKIGEGAYGEAFKGNGHVFKIVPMGGECIVNGELQKTYEEMRSEAFVTLTLNKLRCTEAQARPDSCPYFIKTNSIKVCQGRYDSSLVCAWEDWDANFSSENDNPTLFPEKQLYMLFVLADGGKDLEAFSVSSFNEARSILIQVIMALAVAEESCEFEHRDLHWGNILIARNKASESCCTLQGDDFSITTFGISVQIIDFTLARLRIGTEVLYCNLSADPDLFKGPYGDVQAETYRRMLKLTNGQWENRFFKTNCVWIHYLTTIFLTKKDLNCSLKEVRDLRVFGKRMLAYESAKDAVHDEFFADMLVCQGKHVVT